MNVNNWQRAAPQIGVTQPAVTGEVTEIKKTQVLLAARRGANNDKPGPPAKEVKKEIDGNNNAKRPQAKATGEPEKAVSSRPPQAVHGKALPVPVRPQQAMLGKALPGMPTKADKPAPGKRSEPEVIKGMITQFERLKGKSLSQDEKARITAMVQGMVKVSKKLDPSNKKFIETKMNIGGTEYKTMINSKLKVKVYLPDEKVGILGKGGFGIVKEVGMIIKGTAAPVGIAEKTAVGAAVGDLNTENRLLTKINDLAKKEGISLAIQKKPHIFTNFKNGESSYETTKHHGDLSPKRLVSMSQDEKGSYGLDNTKGLAKIGEDLMTAIAFAHKNGVAHRDIKMDNLAFGQIKSGKGRIEVHDLGLAADRINLKEAGIGGTPTHMTHLDDARQRAERNPANRLELQKKQDSFGMCHTLLTLLDTAITKKVPYTMNDGNITPEKGWVGDFLKLTRAWGDADSGKNPAEQPSMKDLLKNIEKTMGKGFTDVLKGMMHPDPNKRMPVDEALAAWQKASDAIKTGVKL